jgi:hypothetical protein
MYYQPPSFTNLLPWLDYDPEPGVFLLSDGRGLGVLFELRPAGCEARPEAWLEDFRDKLQGVLCSLPEADPPWILQMFVQDEPLHGLLERIAAYGREEARETEYARAWHAILGEHLDDIGRPEGLFADRVGGGRWRGRVRRVRATLTRFYPHPYPGGVPDQEVNDVAARFAGGLEAAGIGVRRCSGQDLWELNVAVVGLLNHIHALVERCQYERRPTLVLIDEAHLITTNPLLAPYVVKITKMWRSFGAWLWLATQNMQDFPDASKRMLNMMVWWLCLAMPAEEVEQIARFRDLTAKERALLLAAGKERGKYTEGVILAPAVRALFRNVPPALALALAMTEQDEKADRAAIMREQGCGELEAAMIMAEQLAAARRAG